MDAPVGRIVSVANGRATVSVDAAKACARCAAGKGCGAGLLTGASRSRLLEAKVASGIALQPGDEVRLNLAPSHLLRAAIFAYGLPLAGVIIALGAGWFMNRAINDRVAAAIGAGGMVAGAFLGRHLLNQDGCLKNLVPTVTERNAKHSDL
jgi:sigma-E factor negative regulatory protein RseC